jgi:hypothetical protein
MPNLRECPKAVNAHDDDRLVALCDLEIEVRSTFAAVGGAVYNGRDGGARVAARSEGVVRRWSSRRTGGVLRFRRAGDGFGRDQPTATFALAWGSLSWEPR